MYANGVRHFINIQDFTKEEIMEIVNLSIEIKHAIKNGYYPPLLKGKTLGMIFQQSSTRTRVSFETAMEQLGGHAQYLGPGMIQLGGHETIGDTGKVLSQLIDIVMARVIDHKTIVDLANACSIPTLNGMSDYSHPTQAIADVITMKEHLPAGKKLEDLKVVYLGDGTQTAASLASVCTLLEMDFVHIGPKEYWFENENNPSHAALPGILKNCENGNGTFTATEDKSYLEGADIIYTDVWYGLYENETPVDVRTKIFGEYQVNRELMNQAAIGVKFMHPLPATRNEDVTDEVLDSDSSLCWLEAGNRLTAMRGLLVFLTQHVRKAAPTELQTAAAKERLEKFMADRGIV